jgi:hypothetical protein
MNCLMPELQIGRAVDACVAAKARFRVKVFIEDLIPRQELSNATDRENQRYHRHPHTELH